MTPLSLERLPLKAKKILIDQVGELHAFVSDALTLLRDLPANEVPDEVWGAGNCGKSFLEGIARELGWDEITTVSEWSVGQVFGLNSLDTLGFSDEELSNLLTPEGNRELRN